MPQCLGTVTALAVVIVQRAPGVDDHEICTLNFVLLTVIQIYVGGNLSYYCKLHERKIVLTELCSCNVSFFLLDLDSRLNVGG